MKEHIVFFGTPDFAVPALEALVKAGYEIVAVVTQPDKPVGRGLKMEAPAVKVKAEELGLKVLQPSMLRLSLGASQGLVLGDLHADLGVCVAYGKIIPKEILNIFPKGVLNIHPSLLPKYRGPSPIQTVIVNGDKETGVTIMLLDEEMDHGPILTRQKIPILLITQNHAAACFCVISTGRELSVELSKIGAELLIETLPKWLAKKINPQAQNHTQATFTKMLEREDGRIDWNKPAEYIERMVRAYDLWPGTWTVWNDKPAQISASQKLQPGRRLKILRASLLHPTIGCASNSAPGYVWKTEDGRLAVNCNPGAVILEDLQPEGKKAMAAKDFLRGSPNFLGSILR